MEDKKSGLFTIVVIGTVVMLTSILVFIISTILVGVEPAVFLLTVMTLISNLLLWKEYYMEKHSKEE